MAGKKRDEGCEVEMSTGERPGCFPAPLEESDLGDTLCIAQKKEAIIYRAARKLKVCVLLIHGMLISSVLFCCFAQKRP